MSLSVFFDKRLLLVFILLFIIINVSFGSNKIQLPSYDSIGFEQKQRLEYELNQRETLENQRVIKPEDVPELKKTNQLCFSIEKIHLSGISILSLKAQQIIINPYQNRCLSINEIQTVAKTITNYYIEQGYITSQAFIQEQNLAQHKLVIEIIEGRIESIDIENSSSNLSTMIYPNLVGEILNLRDIEQGLEQLNRSTTSKYTIDIQPGKTNGYSRIIISKKSTKIPLSSQFTIDNSGTQSTGKTLITGRLWLDSILGLGEQWSVSTNTDTDFSHSHYNRYYVASVNVPYGYWSYRYQFYRNKTRQPFQSTGHIYDYKGKNTNQQFDVNRLIYRDGKQRLTLQSSLKHKKALTQLAQQTLTISSPTLTSFSFSPQYSTILGQGYLTFNPAFELGLSVFGSSPDYIAVDSPRTHYRKYSLSSSYQYYFTNGMTYLTSFYGQYSPDNLYGIERLSIGGQYSVRGYQEQSLSGNRGFYWRNEITTKIASTDIGQLHFIAALDYGYIAGDRYYVVQNTLAGGAIGLSVIGNSKLSSQFLLSKPLYYPSDLTPDNWSMYWSVSLSI